LPARLPDKPKILWSHDLTSQGLGGVAATREFVIVSDRGLKDTADVWVCLAADTGKVVWTHRYPAPGNLDYGNSPRSTPVIRDGRAYLHGAFGHVTCIELATGKVMWELNTHDEFEPEEKPRWGTCATPLLLGDKLLLNPGAKDASLVAVDAKTGKVAWKTPGSPAAYGSFILASLGGKEQIVGHDFNSLGGWDPTTGKRLWKLIPERPNDFNVPTPVVVGDQLLIATENNGARLYAFDKDGKFVPKPTASFRRLAPDTHTPVVASGRVFGVWRRLFCLDVAGGLKPVWEGEDRAFGGYCSIVTDGTRVLVISMEGELILLDAAADKFDPVGRLKVFDGDRSVYSHPAFVDGRAYVRGSLSVVCVALST
jgi:outer membrane protein assembly factor BamB